MRDPGAPLSDLHFGDAFLHDEGNDTLRVVRVCRYTVLVLSLGLGVALYAWTARLAGQAAGIAALFLFALCPNLLAHSRIAANDMTSTIFVFLALFAFEHFLARRTPAGAVAAGITLGLALTAKLSGIIVLPIVAVAALVGPRPTFRHLALGLVASIVTIGAGMGGRFDYGRFVSAFSEIYQGGRKDYLYYLGGAFSPRPWWYYHLYAAGVKTPVPLLLLFGVGVAVFLRRERSWRERVLVLGPIVVFVGASCFDTANMGLRRILPIYPFMILVAAHAVHARLPRTTKALVLAVLGLWQLVSVGRVTPHHLSYFNELVGGPTRGMYHLDDSNIDWGQDLPSLRRWLEAHPDVPIRLAYFGMARPATYRIVLPPMSRAEICSPERAVYAVSAHYLVYFDKVARVDGPECSWLTRYRPVDRIGYSMYVYDFRDAP